MRHLAFLTLRLTVGGLLAGHGAQKLFGAYGGPGLEGTTDWLASMGLRPARRWALMAGISEFGGGLLTILGFLNPMGPLLGMGSMVMASLKVHGGKPIWVTSGGAELPVTNIAVQTALILAGPGRISLDALLGTRLPRWVLVPGFAAIVTTTAYAVTQSEEGTGGEDEPAAEATDAGADGGAATDVGVQDPVVAG